MQRVLPTICRFACWSHRLLVFAAGWLVAAPRAWAQPDLQEGSVDKSHVFSYVLVLLVVALNLLVVLRSSGRTIDVKPRDEA